MGATFLLQPLCIVVIVNAFVDFKIYVADLNGKRWPYNVRDDYSGGASRREVGV